jgi:membrane fusion protein (multidrug efflux system)
VNQDASTDSRTKPGNLFATLRWVALLLVVLGSIGFAIVYWRHSELYPSTDNAYVGSDIVRVSSQVSGPVIRVYVTTDDAVQTDDPLFDIDPTLYDAALRNARAQFDSAVAAAGTAGDNLKQTANTLEDKRKALEDALKAYQNAKDAQGGSTSSALLGWRDALKAYRDAESDFEAAQDKQLTVTTPTVQLRSAAAGLTKSTHDRVKTHVIAPADGIVSNVSLRPGATIQAGTPLFAIIGSNDWWVNANFKETDLARIRLGQPATVRLDMYPSATFDGVVESISAGSGATFSVLPPENATGNWVKVTQRFPVRIKVTNPPHDPAEPLRVGASATVTVDTTQESK